MNGQVSVISTNTYLRVHRMYVATAGSGENAGSSSRLPGCAHHGPDDLADDSDFAASEGQTLQAFYTVPASYTAYLTCVRELADSSSTVNYMSMTFRTREYGGAWRTKNKFICFQDAYQYTYPFPLSIPEKTDIEVRGVANGGTLSVSSSFDLLLLPN